MIKKSCFIVLCILGSYTSAYAQSNECTDGESVSAAQILQRVSNACCSKTRASKCLNGARKRINKARGVISADVASAARTAINALRDASCNIEEVTVPECAAANSTTITEASDNIEGKSCDKTLQSKRKASLKKLRRAAKNARTFLGLDYYQSLVSEVKELLNSEQCGEGGKEAPSGGSCCPRLSNLRDGANGNVYKRSDHGGFPVLVTHNGARSGASFTTSCQKINNWNYTGLANADQNGLRHHYRSPSSCTSYPSTYYLKVGSTCYTVNDRCGRID